MAQPPWWKRARALRRTGLSEQAVADALGKSRGGVVRALHPARYEKFNDAASKAKRTARANRLYARYLEWSLAEQKHPLSRKEFAEMWASVTERKKANRTRG